MFFQRFDHALARRGSLAVTGLSLFLVASCGGGSEPTTSSEAAADTPATPTTTVKADAPAELMKVASVARPEGLPADDPLLGPVLVIDGEMIDHDRIRRQVVLGSAGTVPIEMAKLQVFIEQEIERQLQTGKTSDDFTVTDGEVDDTMDEAKAAIKAQYEEDLDLASFGLEDPNILSQARMEALFRKVFMPEDPNEYPLTTLSALDSNEQGKGILEHLRSTWDERKAAAQAGTRDKMAERMINQIVMEQLVEYLNSTAQIEKGRSVPADLVMRVNGRDIRVDDIWEKIKDRVSDVEVRLAKLWLVNMTLLQKKLAAEGAWVAEEEADALYAAHVADYEGTLFSLDRVALMIKKFPNLEAYREYRQAYESYRKYAQDELNDEETMKAFGRERTKKLIGRTMVDADVILLSAFDFKRRQWKPDGWKEAGERAQEVLRLLVEEGRPWDEVMDDFSDFYDPPKPKSMQGLPDKSYNKGRFRALPRNQLMGMLEESEYWQFLHGTSITDFVFFEQEKGETAAPLRGPYGWYIPRLLNRIQSPDQLIRDQESYMAMVEQDYIMTNLGRLSQQLVSGSEIYGLE